MSSLDGPTDYALAALRQLNLWRHYPAYQLERRADIFFALYLVEVLAKVTGVPIRPIMVPEFPLKQSEEKSSDKVDYLAVSGDGGRAFLVELKTTNSSIAASQCQYLVDAKKLGLRRKLEDIKVILMRPEERTRSGKLKKGLPSRTRKKYFHLLHALEEMKLLRLPPELKARVFSRPQGVFESFAAIEVLPAGTEPSLEIIYVVPRMNPKDAVLSRDDVHCISFEQFADVVERHPDVHSQEFARFLREWGSSEAGDIAP